MLFDYRDGFHVELVEEDGRRPPLQVAVVVLVVYDGVEIRLFLEFLGLNGEGWPANLLRRFERSVFRFLA